MYGPPYERCETEPRQGAEEYARNEKYQVRAWDWDRADSLRHVLARLNRIRRAHPALQHDWGLQFHATDNPQLICYSKRSVDGTDLLLMIVSLDPAHMQHGFVQLPLTAWGLEHTGVFLNATWLDSRIEDALGSRRFNDQPRSVFNVGFIQDLPALNSSFGVTYREQGDAFSRVVSEEVRTTYGPDLEFFVERLVRRPQARLEVVKWSFQ